MCQALGQMFIHSISLDPPDYQQVLLLYFTHNKGAELDWPQETAALGPEVSEAGGESVLQRPVKAGGHTDLMKEL